jgi:hypothetical protein
MSKFCSGWPEPRADRKWRVDGEEKGGSPLRTSAKRRVLGLHRHVQWVPRSAGVQFVI